MMDPILFEACVTSLDQAVRAAQEGAGRIELCGWEAEGGTSPSQELVADVRAAVRIPLFVLVRPRGGDFVYPAPELDRMVAEIAAFREAGVNGVVAGALTRDGAVDQVATARLIAAARPLQFTFHRAFDEAADHAAALEALIRLGADRVLTAGGRSSADAGTAVLRDLVQRAAGRIVILAGGGIRAENVARIVRETGVREVHARTAAGPIVAALRH